MSRDRLQRISMVVFLVIALASSLLLGWVVWRLTQYPDVGATWSHVTGSVDWVDPSGPAFGKLQPGDHVITVDGAPVQEAPLVPDKPPGDSVSLLISHNEESRLVAVSLGRPSLDIVLSRLEPLLIALAFDILGIVVLVFSPASAQNVLLFLSCQASSMTLAAGVTSSLGPAWIAQLFGILIWWLGPLVVHFHLYFPQSTPRRHTSQVMVALYGIAALGSFLAEPLMDGLEGLPLLYAVRRLWLSISLASVVFLLAWAYQHAASYETRRKVGLVSLGGVIAVTPLLFFSLVPDALLRRPLLPYDVSLLFLLVIPAAYGYAILRYHLVRLEHYVNRAVAYALVIVLLIGLYLVAYSVLFHFLPPETRQQPTADLVVMLLLVFAFGPSQHYLQILVNRMFYGGWYDYRRAVQQISQALGRAEDSIALSRILCQEIQEVLQLECACMLLPDGKGGIVTCGTFCRSCSVRQLGEIRMGAAGALGRYLQSQTAPLEVSLVREAVGKAGLSREEAQVLDCGQAQLWIPLPGQDHFCGALILGPRRGGDGLNAVNLAVLEVVIRQASVALKNTYLVAELQQRILECERLHRQVLYASEEERKRIARELHDQIIQELIGLNYQLSELRVELALGLDSRLARLQEEVRHLLSDVRGICADLRPPVLDSLGLVSAVRSRIHEVESQKALRIRLVVEGNEEQDLTEEIALCVYRVLQESLLNVQKHAAAQRVDVTLQISSAEVALLVVDDGNGFNMPQRLGLLTSDGHFGLVGLRERLDLVRGTLEIISAPGKGTRLEAHVPLADSYDLRC